MNLFEIKFNTMKDLVLKDPRFFSLRNQLTASN